MKVQIGIVTLCFAIVALIPFRTAAYTPLEACYNACEAIWEMDNAYCRKLKSAEDRAICWGRANEDRSNCRRACLREALKDKCKE